jgi:hypothetical protein
LAGVSDRFVFFTLQKFTAHPLVSEPPRGHSHYQLPKKKEESKKNGSDEKESVIHTETTRTMSRTLPNIIITGTPGVGKTTHCELLAERTGLKHLSVNDVVKDKECHEGYDEEYQSWIVDEDKVCLLFFSSVFFPFRSLLFSCKTNREKIAARRHRRRGQAGRSNNRLACLRSLSQVLDRSRGGVAGRHGDAL